MFKKFVPLPLLLALACQSDDEADPDALAGMVCRDYIAAVRECVESVAAPNALDCLLFQCGVNSEACLDGMPHREKAEAWRDALDDDCKGFEYDHTEGCGDSVARDGCLRFYFGIAELPSCVFPYEPTYVARPTEALCAE